MKARLVQIGNSRGIRLPKTVLAEAQLDDEVDLKAEPGCIVIRSAKRPRAGWAEAAQKMRQRNEDRLIDFPGSTRFDREEWEWR
jgi:antitoxin MazE